MEVMSTQPGYPDYSHLTFLSFLSFLLIINDIQQTTVNLLTLSLYKFYGIFQVVCFL